MAVNLSFSNIVVLVLLLLQQWMMALHQSWPATTTTHFYDRPAGLSTPDSTLQQTDHVHERDHKQLGGKFSRFHNPHGSIFPPFRHTVLYVYLCGDGQTRQGNGSDGQKLRMAGE
jgi:hypothetical protein